MSKLRECTPGPWSFDRQNEWANGAAITAKQDGYETVLARPVGGFIGAHANAELMALAPDHALIWWADHSDRYCVTTDGKNNDGVEVWLWEVYYDDGGYEEGFHTSGTDPFGFPLLTDDLRARLLAEMGAE